MHVPHIASLHHCLCVSHLCIKMWIGFSWYFLPPQTEVEPQVFLFLSFFFCLKCCLGVRKSCHQLSVCTLVVVPLVESDEGNGSFLFIWPLCFQQVLTAEIHTFTFFWTFFLSLCFSFALLSPPSVSSIFCSLCFTSCSCSCLSCSLSLFFLCVLLRNGRD